MNKTLTGAMVALAACGLVLGGCRVERTRGQRNQVRAITSVFDAELARLDAAQGVTAGDYRALLDHYRRLARAAVRSGSFEFEHVQQAEDELLRLAAEARSTQAYLDWDPDAQRSFDEWFWRNRLAKWEQWRGPDYDLYQALDAEQIED